MGIRTSSATSRIFCLLLSLAPAAAAQAQVKLEPDELLAAHNRLRAKVGVPDLKWSEALAESAQAWADTLEGKGCKLEPSQGETGQNLYWAGPLLWSNGKTEAAQVSAEQVLSNWGADAARYDAAKNECSGGECRSYTQVVWSDTTEVGCGAALCEDSKEQVWVCQYLPPGNVIGERPYSRP